MKTLFDQCKTMDSDKEKRDKAESLLSEFKKDYSLIKDLDPALQLYLDSRFNRIEELIEKILKRID